MSPTLTRELGTYFLLPVLLLDACPVVLSNRLLRSWPFARRPGLYALYGIVLAVLCLINFVLLGPPRLELRWQAALWGLGAGGAAIAIDAFLNLELRRRMRRFAAARPAGRRAPAPPMPRPPRRLKSWERPGKDPWQVDQRFPLVVGLASGALEEAVYRHYFLLLLVDTGAGLASAVILSSLIYGLIHEPFGVVNVLSKTVIGLLFAVAYLASANLLLPLVGHVVLNAAVYLSRRSLRPRGGPGA